MILETMQQRRSVRSFKPELPDRSLLQGLIDAAITAPSASNNQPWRFTLVTRKQTIKAMADAVRTAIGTISSAIADAYQAQFERYGDYFTRFEQAPVVIVPSYKSIQVLSNLVDDSLTPEYLKNIGILEQQSGIVSTSLAIQNLLLYAHDSGLGASCMTGPLIALDAHKKLLSISDNWQIVCFIPVGYPDESPETKPRKSSEKVIRWVE